MLPGVPLEGITARRDDGCTPDKTVCATLNPLATEQQHLTQFGLKKGGWKTKLVQWVPMPLVLAVVAIIVISLLLNSST